MKNESVIRRLRTEKGVSVTDMVDAVRTLYPGYDKPMHSKVEHGEWYGIRLRKDAERMLLHRFDAEPSKRHSSERRKKPRHIQARVSETVYGLLQRRTESAGLTMQDYIEGLILKTIEEEENRE